ncbi:FAD-dependent oxidoreductase [Leifsonia xyli]|uniref:FAD-dependent oxidoreductase n=1 Tax=Leifsonia xyli TaxID=1575 RepID=UPI0002D515FE|nr:FAD-dependent oxidoreductase [Leifsonia xyli]
MGRHYDLVVVVGGGVVGLGHAVAALRRGLTVAVIERAQGVNGASIRNFGHLCVTPQEGEARTYAELARELWLTLAPEAGFWLRESGTVVVAQAADELAVLEEFRDRRGAQDVRLLTSAEVRERVPAGGGVVGGVLLPADLQVDPREAAPAIARWLDAHGVAFFWQTTVTGVETGRVYTSRGRVSADAVVVAVNHDSRSAVPRHRGRPRHPALRSRHDARGRRPRPAALRAGADGLVAAAVRWVCGDPERAGGARAAG